MAFLKTKLMLQRLKNISVTTCSTKASTDSITYGQGLIKLTQKSFCSSIYSTDDSCDEVTVCKVFNNDGEEKYWETPEREILEEKYYLPLDRSENVSKASFLIKTIPIIPV